jgi:hypothetical protein
MEAFAAEPLPPQLVRATGRRRHARVIAIGSALALAAAIALFIGSKDRNREGGERLKGGAGKIGVPAGGAAERVEAGVDVALATTIELDETPGVETFYGVFCGSAAPLEPIRTSLERSPAGVPTVEGCSIDRLSLRKVKP